MTPPSAYSGTEPLRLLHWNIHSWQDIDHTTNAEAVAALIAGLRPHVVSLVEVNEPWGQPSTLQQVAEPLGYTWLFTPAFEFGDDEPQGGFGNALLTTLPVLAFQQWQLLWPPRIYDGSEPSEQRSIAFTRLRHGTRPVWIGTTHAPRRSATARAQTRRRWLHLTNQLTDPWALIGDFNEPANNWATHEGLTTSPLSTPTYPTPEPVEAIDYCVASPDIHLDGHALPIKGSDHQPILVTAHLDKAPRPTTPKSGSQNF